MADLGFKYTIGKDKVLVYRNGKHCGTFSGSKAEQIRRVADRNAGHLQQFLARLTGNYKRGNERNKKGDSDGP